jgi:hypothetical protein
MKFYAFLMILIALTVYPASAFSDSNDQTKDQVYDLLYDYKDAYNARDLKGIENLYTEDSKLHQFFLSSNSSMSYKEFCNNLPDAISKLQDNGFKLNLFRITYIKNVDNQVEARVRWCYRAQDKKGVAWPHFIIVRISGKLKILKENYGRPES